MGVDTSEKVAYPSSLYRKLFPSKAKKSEILNLVKEMNFEILNLCMFFYRKKRVCQKFNKNSFLLTRVYVFKIFSLLKNLFCRKGYILYQNFNI